MHMHNNTMEKMSGFIKFLISRKIFTPFFLFQDASTREQVADVYHQTNDVYKSKKSGSSSTNISKSLKKDAAGNPTTLL